MGDARLGVRVRDAIAGGVGRLEALGASVELVGVAGVTAHLRLRHRGNPDARAALEELVGAVAPDAELAIDEIVDDGDEAPVALVPAARLGRGPGGGGPTGQAAGG